MPYKGVMIRDAKSTPGRPRLDADADAVRVPVMMTADMVRRINAQAPGLRDRSAYIRRAIEAQLKRDERKG